MPVEPPPPRPAGRTWGIRPRLVVDLVLALSFLALMSVTLTGLLVHEVLGLGLMVIVLVHLLAQWDWTLSSTRGLIRRLSGRTRVT